MAQSKALDAAKVRAYEMHVASQIQQAVQKTEGKYVVHEIPSEQKILSVSEQLSTQEIVNRNELTKYSDFVIGRRILWIGPQVTLNFRDDQRDVVEEVLNTASSRSGEMQKAFNREKDRRLHKALVGSETIQIYKTPKTTFGSPANGFNEDNADQVNVGLPLANVRYFKESQIVSKDPAAGQTTLYRIISELRKQLSKRDAFDMGRLNLHHGATFAGLARLDENFINLDYGKPQGINFMSGAQFSVLDIVSQEVSESVLPAMSDVKINEVYTDAKNSDFDSDFALVANSTKLAVALSDLKYVNATGKLTTADASDTVTAISADTDVELCPVWMTESLAAVVKEGGSLEVHSGLDYTANDRPYLHTKFYFDGRRISEKATLLLVIERDS